MTEYRWNNFHGHFPGGFYRTLNIHPEVAQTLDDVLSNMRFDLEQLHVLVERRINIIDEVGDLYKRLKEEQREMTSEELQNEQKVKIEATEIRGAEDLLLEPVYLKMRERGFSHEDLVA